LLLVVSGVVGSMLAAAPSHAATSSTTCEDAPFPSAAWTACELSNLSLSAENPASHLGVVPGLVAATTGYQASRFATVAKDPERRPNPNSCTTALLCPIDPRVQDWAERGGLVDAVLYTSRSGATMSGHVWATQDGPAQRPGVIVINGSIVGYEEAYWYLAQALARSGFVVMTFDVQGEGMSDQFGQAPDQLEDAFAATPTFGLFSPTSTTGPLRLGGNGLTYYDGTQDALDFFLSTPVKPYVPRPSTSTGTSHVAKQTRRVKAGLDNAYNPMWRLLDKSKIGLAGHSYGAEAASWLTQRDPRVSAGVALDSLCLPVSPAPDEATALATPNPDFSAQPGLVRGLPRDCFATPVGPAPEITRPVLGITSDYLLAPTPYLSPPNPLAKSRASLAYSRAGVDTGQIVIRGGTHYDYNDIPIVLPATDRGIDLVTWYTTAWFDKYLNKDPAADARLLSRRWLDDPQARQADPTHDGNVLSWHLDSRLDIHTAQGNAFRCENLRVGCPGMTPKDSDGWSGEYDFTQAAARNR
jgi:dienelactone hydrolase